MQDSGGEVQHSAWLSAAPALAGKTMPSATELPCSRGELCRIAAQSVPSGGAFRYTQWRNERRFASACPRQGVGGGRQPLVWGSHVLFCQGVQEAGAGDLKEAPLPACPSPSHVEGRSRACR